MQYKLRLPVISITDTPDGATSKLIDQRVAYGAKSEFIRLAVADKIEQMDILGIEIYERGAFKCNSQESA